MKENQLLTYSTQELGQLAKKIMSSKPSAASGHMVAAEERTSTGLKSNYYHFDSTGKKMPSKVLCLLRILVAILVCSGTSSILMLS